MGLSAAPFLDGFVTLLAIINPVTVAPAYSELTRGLENRDRRRVFNTAIIVAFGTLTVLTFCGTWLIESVFQIRMTEFRIAGGLLLVIAALRQVVFSTPENLKTDTDRVLELGVVPMAIPMLVGPGTMVASILVLDHDGWVVALMAIAANAVLAWLVVRGSPMIARVLGRQGSLVLARISWIFLAALGVHFLATGLAGLNSGS